MERLIAMLEAYNEETKAISEEMKGCREVTEVTKKADLEQTEDEIKTGPEEVKDTETEANQLKTEDVAEHREVPNEEAAVEKIGATEDRSRDQRLAVRRHGQPKKRAQGNGGCRQKFAALALRKEHGRKGPGRTLGSRMEDRGLKQRRTKDHVVRGAPKERTRLVCKNGVRDRGARQPILMRNGRTVFEALRQKFGSEAVKIAAELSIGLWK
jgi:hypothetical protein